MNTIKDFAHVIRTDNNVQVALMMAAILMVMSPLAGAITGGLGLVIAAHRVGLYRGDADQQQVAASTTHPAC